MSHAPQQTFAGTPKAAAGARQQAQPAARQPVAADGVVVAPRRCAYTFPDGRQCVREASAGEVACSVHR